MISIMIIMIIVPVITMRNKGHATQKTLRVLLLYECEKKEKIRKNLIKIFRKKFKRPENKGKHPSLLLSLDHLEQ